MRGRACRYALNLWVRLEVIFQDGRIEVDNNWVENGMRPIALGGKNEQHLGIEAAGQRAAGSGCGVGGGELQAQWDLREGISGIGVARTQRDVGA